MINILVKSIILFNSHNKSKMKVIIIIPNLHKGKLEEK